MQLLASGAIRKMQAQLNDQTQQVAYRLPIGEQLLDMNALIGKTLQIKYAGDIHCIHCGRKTKKSFSQGYCYPCLTRLAQCDTCIMSPEKCHFDQGTCREPEWGEANCNIDHIVYLANSSGVKVGITRGTQIPTRWLDQGAIQALPILRVSTRKLSGLAEVIFKSHVADKTNWRTMLKGEVESLDLHAERERLLALVEPQLQQLEDSYGLQAISRITDVEETRIEYPVVEYPAKISSFNLDKLPELTAKLMGIKGQYLIFDSGVINLRKYTAYPLQIFCE